jgi:uncharacterized protein
MNAQTSHALPEGLPIPVPEPDGLSAPFWEALTRDELVVQRCGHCRTWQWGPEWICHHCLSFDVRWERTDPEGLVYISERVWHPVHPALTSSVPYTLVLVELPGAGGIRLLGNLLGDPMRDIPIGAPVRGVFEHHQDGGRSYSLLQWQLV